MPRPAIDRFFIRKQQAAKPKSTNLWKAMRMLRRFNVHDLMTVCDLENRRSILRYCSQLRRAGFLKIVDPGHQGLHLPQTFCVARNTGPLAPAALSKRNSMFDPNTHQEHSFDPAT